MPRRSPASRVVAPILVTAITSSMIAVALNLATEWKSDFWAWLAVGVLTLTSGGVSVWLNRRQAAATDESSRFAHEGNEAEIGRWSRVGRTLLEAKQWNRLHTGSHARIKSLTMRAGTTNGSRRTSADMRSDDGAEGSSKPSET